LNCANEELQHNTHNVKKINRVVWPGENFNYWQITKEIVKVNVK